MQLSHPLKMSLLKVICRLGSVTEPWFDRSFQREGIEKILLYQNGGIGDLLRIFPLIEGLQRAFPKAAIDVLTEPHQDLFALFPMRQAISRYLVIDYQRQHLSWRSRLQLIRSLRGQRYDLVISPNRGKGMVTSTLLTFLIGARHRVGFTQDGAGFLYTTKVRFKADRSILQQNLDLLGAIGIPYDEVHLSISIPETDRMAAGALLGQHGVQPDDLLIAVHPGVKWQSDYRSWPVAQYVALTRAILERYDAKIILVGGADQHEVITHFAALMGPRVVSAIGRATISQTAWLIKCASLFIGNDSSLLHIAMALRVPAIGIFGSTPPEQILVADSPSVAIVKDLPCRPCYTHQPIFTLQCDHLSCLRLISVDDVLKAVDEMLDPKIDEAAERKARR